MNELKQFSRSFIQNILFKNPNQPVALLTFPRVLLGLGISEEQQRPYVHCCAAFITLPCPTVTAGLLVAYTEGSAPELTLLCDTCVGTESQSRSPKESYYLWPSTPEN